jgi:hypothetical protein|tara:strand:- start:3076 stop:3489 length:414 start_codon:yes stop_codon:yes gene_type:complete
LADITTSTKISENTREVVYAFQYQYVDGGNESAVSKIDVSGLEKSANGDTCSGIRIVECWWVINAMTVEVLADADTDIIVLHLDEGQSGYQDFSRFGGLPTSSSYGASGTGDIKFTTTGAGAAGDAYQIVIRAIKEY